MNVSWPDIAEILRIVSVLYIEVGPCPPVGPVPGHRVLVLVFLLIEAPTVQLVAPATNSGAFIESLSIEWNGNT